MLFPLTCQVDDPLGTALYHELGVVAGGLHVTLAGPIQLRPSRPSRSASPTCSLARLAAPSGSSSTARLFRRRACSCSAVLSLLCRHSVSTWHPGSPLPVSGEAPCAPQPPSPR